MRKFKNQQIAKLVLLAATVLLVFLLVVIIVQNIQIKSLEQELREILGCVNYVL